MLIKHARCAGVTKAGAQCSRTARIGTLCSQHEKQRANKANVENPEGERKSDETVDVVDTPTDRCLGFCDSIPRCGLWPFTSRVFCVTF